MENNINYLVYYNIEVIRMEKYQILANDKPLLKSDNYRFVILLLLNLKERYPEIKFTLEVVPNDP